ncbi:MAG: hypothetical protein COZ20_02735 [Gallionellales bacterium CG_4_10_14_3_um_filter_54_96]|nr:MAG: hypothetical protein COS43_05015 [Gallionellales bacterium CG03_land_8_20_14_0_80_55_15]PIV91162.1 MAG: hypothetical protein COW45_07315 [Gallionellales bacterium CG17_big_fil_post_rev_8_21_14_2_50_54_146]PIX05113.1 MAG: hypothetical protein COZ77_02930 [Gallionellales bacterium CG_4_8_14_3_um_filter_54_18]PIY05739.1 MAG: hypothetical protein COZ20_02735 [Gallionellales bacterium CG_4_10_14_3_um_filter_54_96]PJC03380.1 MAG: hypothetical protein CO070_08300 [Gallionellales bacterium CG_4
MSSGFEIRREGEINYSKPLARALMRDRRLSFGARGLFAFLWDLPGGWRTNSTHLVSMSPQGRDAIRTLLKELERVGAMRDEPIQEVSGRLAGRRWVLVGPEKWAIESQLASHKYSETVTEVPPKEVLAENRVSRSSVTPKLGKPDTKVYQGKGFATQTTTNQAVEDIDELVEAAVWAFRKAGGAIKNEVGFRHKVRTRIQSCTSGASADDVRSLLAWQADRAAAVERTRAQQAARDQQTERELLTAVNFAEQEKRIATFNLLDHFRREAITRKFSEHLLATNSVLHGFFRRNGLDSKMVLAEFSKFISNLDQ